MSEPFAAPLREWARSRGDASSGTDEFLFSCFKKLAVLLFFHALAAEASCVLDWRIQPDPESAAWALKALLHLPSLNPSC